MTGTDEEKVSDRKKEHGLKTSAQYLGTIQTLQESLGKAQTQ
jgi:hypothetical protein